jgi:hypothetical protein
MKKFIRLFIVLLATVSCNDFMDIIPDNVATLDYAFRDRTRAEQYLYTCYYYLPKFGTLDEPGLVCGDVNWYHPDANNRAQPGWDIMRKGNNVTSPILNYWIGRFQGIRDCNIFIENIDKVMDMDDTEKARWKAEVKVLKAFHYYWLLQMYGPVPVIRENLPVTATADEVALYRDPIDDVADYIVELIDEAVPELPLKIENEVTELGRITQPIALAIKAKTLVTVASPLFNGNTGYSRLTDNKGRQLFPQTYSAEKWERAAMACKSAIDTCLKAGHDLYKFSNPSLNLSKTTERIVECSQIITDKWNKEHIWGQNFNSSYMQVSTLPRLHNDHSRVVYQMFAPTLKMAELYYTANGVPIDEDVNFDYANRYDLVTVDAGNKVFLQPGYETSRLHMNREPRFYGDLGVDGGWWFGLGKTNENSQWPLKFKLGQVEGGMIGTERYSVTGYYIKKLSSYLSTYSSTTFTEKKYNWPVIRLADLYLLYAEALNESLEAPDQEVYDYVNLVRERAGLKSVEESWSQYSVYPEKYKNKEGMRKIIQQERNIELAFEGQRFWDIRRWGLAVEYFKQPIQGWNVYGTTSQDFYQPVTLANLNYSLRDVFWPIAESEMLINPNLLQNPGW